MLTRQYHIDVKRIGTHQQFAPRGVFGEKMTAVLADILARLKSKIREEK